MTNETTIHDNLIGEVVTSRSGTTSDWETEDPILKESEFGIDLDSGKFKIGDGVTKWSELSYFISEASLGDLEGPPGPAGPAGPAGTKIRAVANFTTAVLDDDAQETGTVDLARTYMVLKVATDVPARVRLYRDTASRTADAARLTSVAPTGNHGVVLDVVTTLEDLEWLIAVPGSSELVACPYLVDNLSGSSSAVDVNITYVELEDEPAS